MFNQLYLLTIPSTTLLHRDSLNFSFKVIQTLISHFKNRISKSRYYPIYDPTDAITTHLRNSLDGMLRFNDLVRSLENYDLILVDTRGTKGITVDMSVLASDLVIFPLKPELLSALEFVRGAIRQ